VLLVNWQVSKIGQIPARSYPVSGVPGFTLDPDIMLCRANPGYIEKQHKEGRRKPAKRQSDRKRHQISHCGHLWPGPAQWKSRVNLRPVDMQNISAMAIR